MTQRWQENLNVDSSVRINDQYIVERIRHAVLTQRLPPNTRLPEVTLGEVFGVSRSVIRKALTRLASDHVIVQQPNQVARVAAPDVAETREIFAARRLIEGEVASLLCGHLDTVQLDALDTLVQAEQHAHEQGDEPRRIEQSLAIHHYLADHAPNRILGVMLTDLILRTSIVIALYKRSGMASCYLGDDHAILVELLHHGEPDQARSHVQTHLDSLERLLDLSASETRIDLASIFGATL
ncbi:GntR family transcriptional regulator [Aidingimonas halophila]|uniref:Transcriptional regulator, GntR family n=1 Tax=Aidingimonas halophila TaxID=574349 RepID=A0A1H3GHI5_9GAMM|nr:GntR family transcriptional regulator [Aidingimonas halophila]GHC33267.1 transcriptional regulator [Aidingimonas halophila]SDY02751.1 transcriptional regulator, GntR family [Aidingimonas halophila]